MKIVQSVWTGFLRCGRLGQRTPSSAGGSEKIHTRHIGHSGQLLPAEGTCTLDVSRDCCELGQ
jgi:hypothetical protein